MSQELYYVAPSDEVFEDMKKCAIKVWEAYDDTYGYATEKVDMIKDIGNIADNFMYMYAMFDMHNQAKVMGMVKNDTRVEIQARLNYSL